MSRLLYNLLQPLVLLALLPGYLVRMVRRGNFRAHFGERFGRYAPAVGDRLEALPPRDRVWIHAVSVGEMFVALKLVAALRAARPNLPLIVTTTTVTGRALAQERLPADAVLLYAPLDATWIVRRAFAAIRPALLALTEAEAWPNWLHHARLGAVPVWLLNARLSPRSEARFRRFRALTGPVFRQLAGITVSDPEDISRWAALGVSAECVQPLGNMKFDEATGAADPARTEKFRALLRDTGVTAGARPIVLGGSTHPGEEELLLRVWQALRADFPGLLLALAPRHAERSAEILEMLHRAKVRVASRSQLDPDFTLLHEPDVLLLDSTGELRDWYPLADVVFVGKSLATSVSGGQNPAESLAAGVPTICGPRMENFAALVTEFVRAGALTQVSGENALVAAVRAALADPPAARAQAARAAEVLARHRGAAARQAAVVLGALEEKEEGKRKKEEGPDARG
ncbi:MAG: 3-deoxy-D-manno-octulosonic acid transferase [Verrucomicrobia bacterium]|nr:3-deoxy-D-manno-octulosonic acid transferase [Verrucomicrobiota bacterium]